MRNNALDILAKAAAWFAAARARLSVPSMSRFTSLFVLLLSLAVGMLSLASSVFAMGAFETAGNVRWLVFASRQNLDEAIGLARRFGSDFGSGDR